MFPVHFVYIDPVTNCDREWDAMCHSVPRIGEKVIGREPGAGFVVVRQIFHRFVKQNPNDSEFAQVITVAVGDHDVDWSKYVKA